MASDFTSRPASRRSAEAPTLRTVSRSRSAASPARTARSLPALIWPEAPLPARTLLKRLPFSSPKSASDLSSPPDRLSSSPRGPEKAGWPRIGTASTSALMSHGWSATTRTCTATPFGGGDGRPLVRECSGRDARGQVGSGFRSALGSGRLCGCPRFGGRTRLRHRGERVIAPPVRVVDREDGLRQAVAGDLGADHEDRQQS